MGALYSIFGLPMRFQKVLEIGSMSQPWFMGERFLGPLLIVGLVLLVENDSPNVF